MMLCKDPNEIWIYRFLQEKHKLSSEKKITAYELKKPSTAKENDFSISKYFILFCKIKDTKSFKTATLKDFVIVTNTEFNFSERKGNYVTHNNLVREWKVNFDITIGSYCVFSCATYYNCTSFLWCIVINI